jgi:hypothetical protein
MDAAHCCKGLVNFYQISGEYIPGNTDLDKQYFMNGVSLGRVVFNCMVMPS